MKGRSFPERDGQRNFSFKQKLAICVRDMKPDGSLHCAGCEKRVGECDGKNWTVTEKIQFDHIDNHAAGGRTEIENGRILCVKPCHNAKSRGETTMHADAERQGGRKGQYQRRLADKGGGLKSRNTFQDWKRP